MYAQVLASRKEEMIVDNGTDKSDPGVCPIEHPQSSGEPWPTAWYTICLCVHKKGGKREPHAWEEQAFGRVCERGLQCSWDQDKSSGDHGEIEDK